MKKIVLSLIILITIIGCSQKPIITTIVLTNIDNIEYGSTIYLDNLISISNGTLLTDNYQIDTDYLGTKDITIDYKDSNNKKHHEYFTINITDTTPPIIASSNNIYILKDSTTPLIKKTLCGDNADRNLICNIEGNYDINTTGNYNLKFTATDQSGNTTTKAFTLHVVSSFDNNEPIQTTPFADYYTNYKTDQTEIGLDLSSHQGNIDWEKLKNSNISFVILRIGTGPNSDGIINMDQKFEEYYIAAKNIGLKVGVYFYSYATTKDEINLITNWLNSNLQNKNIDLPIAYDWESWNYFNGSNLNFYDLNEQAILFLNNLKEKGYQVMNYGSKYYLENIWQTNNYPTWLAHYVNKTSYNQNYFMWQITESASVDGIEGPVDVDILYH